LIIAMTKKMDWMRTMKIIMRMKMIITKRQKRIILIMRTMMGNRMKRKKEIMMKMHKITLIVAIWIHKIRALLVRKISQISIMEQILKMSLRAQVLNITYR